MLDIKDKKYTNYYRDQKVLKIYPTEFVVRSFMGAYPNLKLDKSQFFGKNILDLGFGDGRNMGLLHDLGFKVHGVEVTEDICNMIMDRMRNLGIDVDARAGRNSAIPFDDGYFDSLLACNSCYYIDPGQTVRDNYQEIARVIKPGGIFIHSLPMPTTFIMENAIDRGSGHMEITQDPYGVRVGAILKKFDTPEEIKSYLDPWFTDIRIGSCQDDYWGSKVHLWFVVCTRK